MPRRKDPPKSHALQAFNAVFDSGLDPRARLVLLAYARHLGNWHWDVWPSAGTVARMTGLSLSTVKRKRGGLVRGGVLTPVGAPHERRQHGRGRSAVCLRVDLAALVARPDQGVTVTPNAADQGITVIPKTADQGITVTSAGRAAVAGGASVSKALRASTGGPKRPEEHKSTENLKRRKRAAGARGPLDPDPARPVVTEEALAEFTPWYDDMVARCDAIYAAHPGPREWEKEMEIEREVERLCDEVTAPHEAALGRPLYLALMDEYEDRRSAARDAAAAAALALMADADPFLLPATLPGRRAGSGRIPNPEPEEASR